MSQKFANGAKNLPPRHLHNDEPQSSSKKDSAPAKASKSALEKEVNAPQVPNSIRHRFARRPFLHILVLFASDTRVLNYAKEVQQILLDHGIDVLLQAKAPDDQWIKTDNLSNIINDSIADYLVVLGDRNMKNHSCSCRNKGKLTEVKIEEVIATMWSEWASKVVDDGQFPIKDMKKGTIEQVYQLLDHACSIRRLKERMDQLKKDVDEFKHFARSLGHFANESLQPSAEREKIASQITATQKSLINLHQRLIKAVEVLHQLPLHNQKTPANSGRGIAVDADYRPAELKPGVPASLRDQTLQEVQRLIPKVEKFGADLTEAGAPLWLAYWTDYLKTAKPAAAESSFSSSGTSSSSSSSKKTSQAAAAAAAQAAQAAAAAEKTSSAPPAGAAAPKGGTWSCSVCTFDNAAELPACEMCQTPRVVPTTTDWEMTGTAGKKQRKEKREEEERLAAERAEEERRKAEARAKAAAEEEKKAREKRKLDAQKAAAAQPQKAAPPPVPLASPAHVSGPVASPVAAIAAPAPGQAAARPAAQPAAQPVRAAPAAHAAAPTPALAAAAGWKAQQPQQAKSVPYQPPPQPKAPPVSGTGPNPLQNAEYKKNYPSLSGAMADLDLEQQQQPAPSASATPEASQQSSPPSSQSSLASQSSQSSQQQQPPPTSLLQPPAGAALAAPPAQPVTRQTPQPQLLSQLPPFAASVAPFVPASQQAAYQQQQQQQMQQQQQQLQQQQLQQQQMHGSVFAQHGPQSVFSQGFGQPQAGGYGYGQPQQQGPSGNQKYAPPLLTPQQQAQYDQQQQQQPSQQQQSYMSPQQQSHMLSGLWTADGQQQGQSSSSAASVTSAPGSSQFSPFAYMSQPQVYNNWAAAFTPMSTYAPSYPQAYQNPHVSQQQQAQYGGYIPQQQQVPQHQQQQQQSPYGAGSLVPPPTAEEVAAAASQTPEERERDAVRSFIAQKLNGFKPQRPCHYCGDESQLECNLCAKIGYVATYFCSAEHQSLMWKEHLDYHRRLHESIYGPGSGTSTNSMLSSSTAT